MDLFIDAMIEIAHEIENDPESLHNAPFDTPVRRVDDVRAVKILNLRHKQ